MKLSFGKNKIKAVAVVLCAVITAGSLTYMTPEKNTLKTHARTVSEIEDEKAENQKKIDELQQEIDNIKYDVAQKEEYQIQLQKKIDLQNENIDNVNTVINDLNDKISQKQDKIDQLKLDISEKQTDIDEGLELFKDRLRAMYVSGNDSLASALVGSTDFYDMLAKIELISQVAKHDDELIEKLTTQLEQYKEAQAQLDIEKADLNTDLEAQEENRRELRKYRDELQADYSLSADYLERQKAEMNAQQRDIDSLQADNEAYDAEIDEINEALRQSQVSSYSDDDYYENDYSSNDYSYNEDDDDDYYDDDSGSSDTSYSGGYSGLSWPVPGFYGISSGYGYRWGSFHRGIDIAGGGIAGATVTAAGSGTVVLVKTGCSHNYGKDGSCGCNGGYGNYVVIDNGSGISTTYGHCADIYVSVGQSVSGGQAIGSVGSTGWSTGFHLHFEVQVNGSSVDPTSYV